MSWSTRIIVLAIVGISFGCVVGKRDESKPPLARLNGESSGSAATHSHTDTPIVSDGVVSLNALGGMPVIIHSDQKKRVTRVSGTVWIGKGIDRTPGRQIAVQIIKDKTILVEGQTDSRGEFKLFEVMPDGRYTLRTKFKDSKLDTPITVSGYEVKDLQIQLDQ